MRGLSIRRTWRTTWRTPGLTALVVLTLSFGLAVWLVTNSARRSFEEDPLQHVTGLYRVELVRFEEFGRALAGTDMRMVSQTPKLILSEAEVRSFSSSPIPSRVAPITAATLPALPDGRTPSQERARFVGHHAFDLFGLRLSAGRPLSADAARDRELVLSNEAARSWFGGESSALGRRVQLNGAPWTVVGVLVDQAAAGRRLHFTDGVTDPALWLPFEAAAAMNVVPSTRHAAPAAAGGMLHASLWVELPTTAAVEAYTQFARQTAAAQGLPAGSVRLRSYREWSGVLGAPPAYRVFELFGVVVLIACAASVVRLLHTRFRMRAGELAIRRAIGAARIDVFGELLCEAALISMLGAVAGVLLSAGMLAALVLVFPVDAAMIRLSPDRILAGLGIGLGVGLLAAVVPAWRLCREPVAHALRRA
jgi:putative ABC transport system permease protein